MFDNRLLMPFGMYVIMFCGWLLLFIYIYLYSIWLHVQFFFSHLRSIVRLKKSTVFRFASAIIVSVNVHKALR